MEIERKWLIKNKPQNLPVIYHAIVYQGYLCTKPTVRIRSMTIDGKEPNYILCIKGKGTLCRTEVETHITESQFIELKGIIGRDLIKKDFTTYSLKDGHILEFSIVDKEKPTSFSYCEVEFESVEEADLFIPPFDFEEEVTEKFGYSMSDYWNKLNS